MNDLSEIAETALKIAKQIGADQASVLVARSQSTEASLREGALEQLESAEDLSLEFTLYAGQSHASVTTGSLSPENLQETASRALAMAKRAPADPLAALAEPELLAREFPDLELTDPRAVDVEALKSLAARAEQSALAINGVTKSAGASASSTQLQFARAMSNGFRGSGTRTGFAYSISVIAGEGSQMERDYDYSTANWFDELESPEIIGKNAGERAIARLHPRKVKSQSLSVIYDPRVASSLISHLASAASGSAIARGTSFLKDSRGHKLFPEHIRIMDDPLLKRRPGSRAFDSDGIAGKPMSIIAEGVLENFLLDLRSARQLNLTPTGHARGISNFWMAAGELTPDDLMADIKQGFYVTELMGHGANLVTGDYSRGASGFFIENGKITYPVSEVTIAGNLKDMWANLTPASDLKFRGTINAPTCRVEGMTLAGA